MVPENSVRLQNQQDTVRLRNIVTWFGRLAPKAYLSLCWEQLPRTFRPARFKAACEAATWDRERGDGRLASGRLRTVRATSRSTVRRKFEEFSPRCRFRALKRVEFHKLHANSTAGDRVKLVSTSP